MLSVVYASGLDPLLDALIERSALERARNEEHPLEPLSIIVPNRATSALVKLELAARTGIAANLKLELFERFLIDRLAGPATVAGGAAKTPPLAGPAVADGDVVLLLLLEIFLDEEALRDPLLAPVREYVEAGGEDPDARDLRRYQLAAETARLFREYRLTRRDMIVAWEHRLVLEGGESAGVERWQRALSRRLARRLGPGAPLALLPDALERARLGSLELPRHVHVFGVTTLSPAHVEMLRRLGEQIAVHVYAVNPCREYWGDTASVDTPVLTMWGRAGRATIHALNEAVGFDFEDRFAPPREERSTLDVLSNDVLEGRSPSPADASLGAGPEQGIVVWSCPGARREIEVVASEIWRRVLDNPSRSFRDFAVVLAGRDREAYRAHVGSVFAEAHGIPHHFHDVPIAASSRIVDAIELLLALPASSFSRQDLLRILLHPAIGARDGADTSEWLRWLDALGVVHGADHGDHEGTYIEKDLYNWDQGMRRLVLGAMLSGERSRDDRAFDLEHDAYHPLEHALDRSGNAARLVVLVRSLIADARFARSARLRLSEWVELVRVLVTSYVHADTDSDARDLELCLSAIQDLSAADVLEAPLSFAIAKSVVSATLARLKVGRGQPLADGVAVGPLSALATIPFAMVFIIGLGEGQFPASDRSTQLDVRRATRRPWDVSAREEDEYLFLLRLLATRERVVLSHIARDARTGDRLEPSSIVLELEAAFARSGLPLETVEHALRRFDPRCFEGGAVVSVPARRERAVLELRAELEAFLESHHGEDAPLPDLPELRRELAPGVKAALEAHLGLCPIPDPSQGVARDGVVHVPLWILARFLEDPREAWTKLALGLYDFDALEDPLARSDEAFAAGPLEATTLLRALFIERLEVEEVPDEPAFFRDAYRRRAARLERLGVLPTGVFGEAEEAKHLAILAGWSARLRAEHAGELALTEGLRFGRAREDVRGGALLDPDPLDLELPTPGAGPRRVRVEITGSTPPRLRPATTLVLGLGREASFRSVLRAFVEECANAALGHGAPGVHRVLVLAGEGPPISERFEPISRSEGLGYLEALALELLSGPHTDHLPHEVVLEGRSPARRGARLPSELPPAPTPPAEQIEQIRARRFGFLLAKKRRSA